MEEQRMLDEMERALAADDPRLASRLNAFGQQRLPGLFSSSRSKTISGLLALALIGAVTVVMFVLSPYAGHHAPPPRTTPSAATKSAGSSSSTSQSGTSHSSAVGGP
ncbi:MAG TPA: DUF3040 domain-containing protein [Streptosporangiaceae bacterium]|jgi:hypothetical protein